MMITANLYRTLAFCEFPANTLKELSKMKPIEEAFVHKLRNRVFPKLCNLI